MPVSILVRLRGGRYDAGAERPSQSEWPPHPARVFCALAASAESDSDWATLRWLEQQGRPQVIADPADRVHRSQARAYVVQNSVEKGGGNLTWPGRTNGLRSRASAVPAGESFAIVWPEAEPSADLLSLINLLAWRVPYVGRSTSLAHVSAVGVLPDRARGAVVYEPAELGQSGQFVGLRVPYVGYTDALRDAYVHGRRSWEVSGTYPYTAVRDESGSQGEVLAPPALPGPFADLIVWGVERGIARVGGDQVVTLASAFRRAVLSLVSEPVPGQVSGHTSPGVPHVAYLVIPDVDHDHADGHVLGCGLALPSDLPPEHLRSLVRALLFDPTLTYLGFGGHRVALRYGAESVGLRASRWTASGRGEREWVTVTPVMLDGHTRRGRDEAAEVSRSLVIAGYPEPEGVEVSGLPMVTGGIWRPRRGSLPEGRPRRQMVHARVRFAGPVTGPVIAGSMRYLGLGLFLPVRPPRLSDAAAKADELAEHVAQADADAGELAEVTR